MGRLTGRVAWVTGSSRGIGRVVADHLASLGANVVIHGTTPTSTQQLGEGDSLTALADEIAQAHNTEVLPVHGDLTDDAFDVRLDDMLHLHGFDDCHLLAFSNFISIRDIDRNNRPLDR